VRPAAPRSSAARPIIVAGEPSAEAREEDSRAASPTASTEAGGEEKDLVPEIDVEALKLEDEMFGSNGQVEIFKGEYKGEVVTVKKLTKFTRMNLREQVQFSREMNALAKLSHPKLVKLLGVCLTVRPVRMVVEYCAGGSLYELLHNSFEVQLSWTQKLKMVEDVSETMVYLHSKNFIHRDLTSLNLMLADELRSPADIPVVKVCDLCSARIMDPTEDWGQMTKDVGTLVWSAPEILTQKAYDEKVDVYSFSMVLFEVICREPPFEDLDMVDIARTVSAGGRPTLEAVPPECPDTMRNLMVACWAPTPADRPTFDKVYDEVHTVRLAAEGG